MKEPTFDADGYPTEETLAAIRVWPWQDVNALLDFIAEAWHWPDFVSRELRPEEASIVHAEPEDRYLRLATGGWSGNEDLIAALRENMMARALTWRLTARGGLHIYEFRKDP